MCMHKQSAHVNSYDEHAIAQTPIIVEDKFSVYSLANIFYWNILARIAPKIYTCLNTNTLAS